MPTPMKNNVTEEETVVCNWGSVKLTIRGGEGISYLDRVVIGGGAGKSIFKKYLLVQFLDLQTCGKPVYCCPYFSKHIGLTSAFP